MTPLELWTQLDAETWAAGQLSVADVEAAAAAGVRLIINNRPDGEEAGQPSGAEIEAAARAAGLAYAAVPVTGRPGPDEAAAMARALAGADGPVLAYCRSGGRSAACWSLAQPLL